MDPMNQMKDYITKKRKADNLETKSSSSTSSRYLLPTPAPGSSLHHKAESSDHSKDKLHHTHKHKKHKKGKKKSEELKRELEDEKRSHLEKLRQERKKREEAEKTRTEAMLKGHYGRDEMKEVKDSDDVERPGRYFSQFNPHLARQSRT